MGYYSPTSVTLYYLTIKEVYSCIASHAVATSATTIAHHTSRQAPPRDRIIIYLIITLNSGQGGVFVVIVLAVVKVSACWRRMRARDGRRNVRLIRGSGCGGGGEKDLPSGGKSATELLPHQPSIGETASRDRDGTEDIYLYTDSVGPRRSLHEPTRSSDDGKSCSGRRAPDVPVAGH